jgi:hypothetical protein
MNISKTLALKNPPYPASRKTDGDRGLKGDNNSIEKIFI